MSKIKGYLEELAEITMIRAKQIKLTYPKQVEDAQLDLLDLEASAKVLGIITKALVELGINDGIESKVTNTYLELTTCDWEGNPDATPIKIKPDAILSYSEAIHTSTENLEIKLIDILTFGRSYSLKMTIKEFEELLFGEEKREKE